MQLSLPLQVAHITTLCKLFAKVAHSTLGNKENLLRTRWKYEQHSLYNLECNNVAQVACKRKIWLANNDSHCSWIYRWMQNNAVLFRTACKVSLLKFNPMNFLYHKSVELYINHCIRLKEQRWFVNIPVHLHMFYVVEVVVFCSWPIP